MKKIMVTGGAGYIGSHAAKCLAAAGLEPVVFDNLSAGHADFVRWGPFVQADLADGHAIRDTLRAHQITAVVHFAACAYVGESMRNPQKYFRNNVVNTLNLLDAMLDCGVKTIVFSSTCATYGNPRRLPLTEAHPQVPVNPYGESKLFVERVLRWYGEIHGLNWFALRYFNAAGADPDGELGEEHAPETHLVPLLIQAALGVCRPLRPAEAKTGVPTDSSCKTALNLTEFRPRTAETTRFCPEQPVKNGQDPRTNAKSDRLLGQRESVQVFGTDYPTPDGTAIRDYIHVSDLAEAHLLALRHLAGGGASGACNLGTGKGHSVMEVIRAVEAVTGKTVPIMLADRRAGDPPVLVASTARARRVLGWKPRFSDLRTIVETAAAWHAARPC